jgi:RNA polymerase sigma-70 factor (ECF subfamily)
LVAEELEAVVASKPQIPDERLSLMFACTHPAIERGIRAPLMLQTILGFDAATIASAFLVSPATMGLGCVKTFRSGPKLLPTGWRAPSSALVGFFCDCEVEPLLKLPEVILSDLETPRQPAAQARIAARSGFTPTMFITRVRL